ncbi:MAG: 16S rRNA (cytidine(1402)-2'-O)-methyltransferase [Patescibacteria group bacterium]
MSTLLSSTGKLSVVATPIGNLEDMSPRGIRVLKHADVIACEDARMTGSLLAHLGIEKKKFITLNQRASDVALKEITDRIHSGETIAYVSDAGTPNVNDPGGRLVAAIFDAHCPIETIPGPSALTAAIAVCGFPMDRYHYAGFLPTKKHRTSTIKAIALDEEPTVFFESTHRIEKTLKEFQVVLDDKRLVYLGRELTKKFETHYRGTISEVIAALVKGSIKGEFVCIIGPGSH